MGSSNPAENSDVPPAAEADAPAASTTQAEAPSPPAALDSPAPTGDEAPADAVAKPKKKKKKRRREPAEPGRDPLRPDGRERPAFILDYPSDPELDRLVQAFELGNYAFVREHAPLLAKKTGDERVRAAAGELARRIEPDPLVKVLLGMSVGLLLVLAFWAYKTHGN